jgi:SPP1 family predicted phage head-tail adaptor
MIRAGTLRHKINFMTIEKIKNSLGETTEEFLFYKTTSAAIVKNRLSEESIADGSTFGNFKTFHLRYKTWISEAQAIEFGGEKYLIKSIENPNHKNIELFITAEAL